jgi:hypothetical protein
MQERCEESYKQKTKVHSEGKEKKKQKQGLICKLMY